MALGLILLIVALCLALFDAAHGRSLTSVALIIVIFVMLLRMAV